MSRLASLLLLTLLVACSPEAPPPPRVDTVGAAADSLVLVLPDSTRVWLTPGRRGTAGDGTKCQEYGVRIGTEKESRLVPLLYVRTPPRFEGGRLLATVSSDCLPGANYQIDPATAQPTLIRGGVR